MSLPSVKTVRSRVEAVDEKPIRNCFKTAYLYAGRISEVIGVATPGDTSVARGPTKEDVRIEDYAGEEIAVFTVRTAKRKGRIRNVAIPLRYEPWARDVYDYFQTVKEGPIYPFDRHSAWLISTSAFQGLTYPIETYKVVAVEDGAKVLKDVDEHIRAFRLHALRHLRATELVEHYGFDGFQLATYGGWMPTTTTRISSVIQRYLSLSWQSYIDKLLKRR